jgi:hypothetical protein
LAQDQASRRKRGKAGDRARVHQRTAALSTGKDNESCVMFQRRMRISSVVLVALLGGSALVGSIVTAAGASERVLTHAQRQDIPSRNRSEQ